MKTKSIPKDVKEKVKDVIKAFNRKMLQDKRGHPIFPLSREKVNNLQLQ